MPNASPKMIELVTVTSPVSAAVEGYTQLGGQYDHVMLFVDFTISSLTNIVLSMQQSVDGVNWYDCYSSNGVQVVRTMAASFTAWFLQGVEVSQVQHDPWPIAAPFWRIKATPTGTAGSSSIEVWGMPYTLGGTT